jgi:hypothetical protein
MEEVIGDIQTYLFIPKPTRNFIFFWLFSGRGIHSGAVHPIIPSNSEMKCRLPPNVVAIFLVK